MSQCSKTFRISPFVTNHATCYLLHLFLSFLHFLAYCLLSLAAPAQFTIVKTSVGWVFEFFFGLITVSFQFIKYFKIWRNHWCHFILFYFIFWKSKSKNRQHRFFWKPQRTGSFHEWTIKNMQFFGWLFHFSSFLRTMVIYQNPFFIFPRTMVINQRTVPVTTGSVPVCYDHKGLFLFLF